MRLSLTDFLRNFTFLREAGQNKGQRVEAIQHWCGGTPGQSWCCYFITFGLDVCYAGSAPIKRLGACQDVYDIAKRGENGVRLLAQAETPLKDDLYLFVNDEGHAHHIGVVTTDTKYGDTIFNGLAGNTSEDGKSSNGDRAAERPIPFGNYVKFVRYPK